MCRCNRYTTAATLWRTRSKVKGNFYFFFTSKVKSFIIHINLKPVLNPITSSRMKWSKTPNVSEDASNRISHAHTGGFIHSSIIVKSPEQHIATRLHSLMWSPCWDHWAMPAAAERPCFILIFVTYLIRAASQSCSYSHTHERKGPRLLAGSAFVFIMCGPAVQPQLFWVITA